MSGGAKGDKEAVGGAKGAVAGVTAAATVTAKPATARTSTARTGAAGEDAAAAYLLGAGYEIRHRNWREGRYELDIVAVKDGILHFVEVKTRRAGSLTSPEEAITAQKFRALTRAGACYMRAACNRLEVQFDLAAVDVHPDGRMDVRLIENAMEYHW